MKAIPLGLLASLQAKQYPRETCLLVRDNDKEVWRSVTWQEVADEVKMLAQAMCELGIGVQEKVAVFSENATRFIYSDLATYAIRAVAIPLYATSSTAQVVHTLRDSGAKLLFVGAQYQYNTAFRALSEVEHDVTLVIFSNDVRRHPDDVSSIYYEDFVQLGHTSSAEAQVSLRQSEATLADSAVILYTSGTTGESRGVELTHRTVIAAIEQHCESLPKTHPGEVSMNFLPMTHIFEKMWCLFCMRQRVIVAIGENPHDILRNLKEVSPHYMCNVPRFWEKVYMGVHEVIAKLPSLLRRLTLQSKNVGERYHLEYRVKGKSVPFGLRLQYWFYSNTLLRMVRQKLGINRGKMFPTASATLTDDVHAFLLSLGIPIVYGYGLTETTATVTFCHPDGFKLGSVGRPLKGVEIRTDEKGEIEVRGETVMKGYYNRPADNAETFTADGWFRTGDLGYIDAEGNLYFRERAKDLFKTANGKIIVPQMIEKLLLMDPAVDQVIIIADNRSFVSALIHPNWEYLCTQIEKKGLGEEVPTSPEELAKLPVTQMLMMGRIEEAQKGLASYEKVKRFVLITEPFTIENGMLTNSLKVKRKVVEAHYASQINQLYQKK